MPEKSSVDTIRRRFDADVDRFSNLDTGQSATIDAPLVLDLITEAAAATTPNATHLLDVGCGAGNYALKLLQRIPHLHITLVDLSHPMLTRAQERLTGAGAQSLTPHQSDIRELNLPPNSHDIVLAAAVLHHLRTDAEWEHVFTKFFHTLRPGGSLWISDLITHTTPAVQSMMWTRYGHYLSTLKNDTYRDAVFAYIDQEDSPKPLLYQLDLLRKVGFTDLEILHKTSVFAAFGARKPA